MIDNGMCLIALVAWTRARCSKHMRLVGVGARGLPVAWFGSTMFAADKLGGE